MDISNTFINNADLLRLDLYISRSDYLKEEVSCFTEIIIENKVQEIVKKLKVSDSKEEKKR